MPTNPPPMTGDQEESKMSGTRYRLVTDDSCHHYVIPADKLREWNKWYDSEDAKSGVTPDWARAIGGSVPELLTFDNPEIE